MRTFAATVLHTRLLSPHLARVALRCPSDYPTTGIPDEYARVLIPPPGEDLVLPEVDDSWRASYPPGAAEPAPRVYTLSDHRRVDGDVVVDLDIVLHAGGVGSAWVRDCRPGDTVGLVEPHGVYAAAPHVGWQLLVADLTGLPALARILRGLSPEQRAEAVVVVPDPADELPLPSMADVEVTWLTVDDPGEIGDTLTRVVTTRGLPPADVIGGRYLWLAGEARASRAVRRHLRRELGWPQHDFYTCGYWQVDAERWKRRYEQVADQVIDEALEAEKRAQGDEGVYLDALDDIYDNAGL